MFHWVIGCQLYPKGDKFDYDAKQVLNYDFTFIPYRTYAVYCNSLADYNKNPDDEHLITAFESLVKLVKEHPTIGRLVQKPSHKKSFMQLFYRYYFLAFSFVDKYPLEFAYSFKTLNELADFFQNHYILVDKNITKIQKGIYDQFKFPGCGLPVNPTREFSMVNEAIAKNKHFIDLSLARGIEYKEFKGWMYLANKRTLNDIDLSKIDLDSLGNSLVGQYLRRLSNDFVLCSKLKKITGKSLIRSDLETKSIPKLCEIVMNGRNLQEFEEFQSIDCLSITNEDFSIDFSFICSYMAIITFIHYFRHDDTDCLDTIDYWIKQITDPQILSKLATDLFSLLFLQKDGHFVCSFIFAEGILTRLLDYIDDKDLITYVAQGHLKIQYMRNLLAGETIEKLLLSSDQYFIQFFNLHDWDMAERMTFGNEKLQEIVENGKAVCNYKNTRKLPPKEHSIDVYCSFPDFEDIEVESPYSEIIRKNSRYLDMCKPDAQSEAIMKPLYDLSASVWNPIYVPFNGLTKTFMLYLDSLIQPILEQNVVSTVSDALSKNVDNVLRDLFREERTEAVYKLAETLHIDLHAFVFSQKIYTQAILKDFAEDCPPAVLALSVDTPSLHSSIQSPVLKRYLNQVPEEEQKFDFIELLQNEKYEDFIDASYQHSSQDISGDVFDLLTNDNLQPIYRCFKESCIPEELFERINFLAHLQRHGVQPFPIESLGERLKQDNTLEQFNSLFPYYAYHFEQPEIIEIEEEEKPEFDLNELEINSVEGELEARNKVHLSGNTFLISLLDKGIYSRFAIPYSLHGFETNEFAFKIAKICFNLDYLDLLNQLEQAYEIDLFDYYEDYVRIFYSFKIPDLICVPFKNYSELTQNQAQKRVETIDSILNILNKNPFFDTNIVRLLLKQTAVPDTDFYLRIREFSKEGASFNPILENAHIIDTLLVTKASPAQRILYQVQHEIAPEAYEKVPFIELTSTLLGFQTFDSLISKLPGYTQALYKLASEKSVFHMKLKLEKQLGKYEQAIDSAISLYCDNEVPSRANHYLNIAQQSIEELLKLPTSNRILLEDKLGDLNRQNKFNQFCIETNQVELVTSLNVFEVNKRETMILLLFKHKRFDLGIDVMMHYKMDVRLLMERTIDSFLNEQPEEIEELVNGLRQNSNPILFHQMVFFILNRLWFSLANVFPESVMYAKVVIMKCINDPVLQCEFALQFDLIEEAFSIAQSHKLMEFVPLIGRNAHLLGYHTIYNKCQKLFE